ncbi:MAG: hypothetical protein Q9178_005300 [Gyalolechia marmorata]
MLRARGHYQYGVPLQVQWRSFKLLVLRKLVIVKTRLTPRSGKTFGVSFSQHKQVQLREKDARETLQVIGVGLRRTGTSSLKAALKVLGFDPCNHMVVCSISQGVPPSVFEIVDEILNRNVTPTHPTASPSQTSSKQNQTPTPPDELSGAITAVRKCLRGYRAAVDAPIYDVYAELLTIFPDAKFILSVCDSDDI